MIARPSHAATPIEVLACTTELLAHGHWKLIRDKLPVIFAEEGDHYDLTQLPPELQPRFLIWKMVEELSEFQKTPNAEEMADMLEVLKTLMDVHGLDPMEVEKIRAAKAATKGGFSAGFAIKIPGT